MLQHREKKEESQIRLITVPGRAGKEESQRAVRRQGDGRRGVQRWALALGPGGGGVEGRAGREEVGWAESVGGEPKDWQRWGGGEAGRRGAGNAPLGL